MKFRFLGQGLSTTLLLLILIFVPVGLGFTQDCMFEPLMMLTIPATPAEVLGSDIVNASFAASRLSQLRGTINFLVVIE
jgi:hypothetical protein